MYIGHTPGHICRPFKGTNADANVYLMNNYKCQKINNTIIIILFGEFATAIHV